MLQLVKKHWLVGCIIIAAVCITTTWQALNELLVRPRDYEINQLETKVNELEKELTKKKSSQASTPDKICKKKNRIAIHSKKGEADERGIQLIKYINNLGCIATGIISVSQNIIFPDLRYFHESDYQEANQFRKLILNELGLELTLNYIPEYSHKAKEGYFEIWLK